MIETGLIVMPSVIKQRTALHTNVDDKLIYPEIKAAQDMYVMPLLGSALFNKIITDIKAGTLTGDYKTLVDNYIIDMICNYVLSEMPDSINYQFWNKGVATKTTEDSNTPSMSEMYAIVAKYKNRAEHYSKRCRMYLIENAPTKFPEYINIPGGVDVVVPDRTSFSSPIYLGDEFEKPRSYSDRYQGDRPYNSDY